MLTYPSATIVALLSIAVVASAQPVESRPMNADNPPKLAGLLADRDVFPIAVWLQNPNHAARYKQLGINLYVALWNGPTEAQLDALEKAGMSVICHPNAIALRNKHRPIIAAWMHGDEPDNAQSLGQGKGYGPPIKPETIVADYQRIKQLDPARPVLLNLGQGVAWDGWYGRGVRTNHPEDYPAYLKGCDIASFDIYPATHQRREVAGKLWFVARGVERLRQWTDGQKPVWACIECTHVDNPDRKPTPREVKAEVWMALTHGATGLIYFSHEFKPKFIEAGMLADPEMAQAIQAINAQIHQLAAVLKSPTAAGTVAVSSSHADVPIATLLKQHAGDTYLFAVAMRDGATSGSFAVEGLKGAAQVTVLGENRTLHAIDGRFEDAFDGYGVHLYRISAVPQP